VIERLQRNAVAACLLMTAIAAVATRTLAAPAAVLGGGLLVGISFMSIRGGVDLASNRSAGLALQKLAGRYALLGFLAYVMIARLRLPPLALMAGASSVVAAAVVEAVRLLWTKNTKI